MFDTVSKINNEGAAPNEREALNIPNALLADKPADAAVNDLALRLALWWCHEGDDLTSDDVINVATDFRNFLLWRPEEV